MQRIATATRAPDLWGVGKAGFKEGDVLTGDPATSLSADWFNSTQEEICNVIEGVSLTLDINNRTQLKTAIAAMISTAVSGFQAQINNLAATNIVPSGAVAHFARNTAPTGWLAADGALVSRTTYAALFSAIGTTYGAGDGSTTFKLPDLRGEFLRGWDNGRGVDGGRSFGSAQSDAFQGHYHEVYGSFPSASTDEGATIRNAVTVKTSDNSINYTNPFKDIKNPVDDGTHGSPRTASETRPRNVAILVCIKT